MPQPAKAVDLDRYVGRWYEFARYENRFERGCDGVTADYAKREDGLVGVRNTCREDGPSGRARSSDGRAKIVANSGDAKLKVSFFGPFFCKRRFHKDWSARRRVFQQIRQQPSLRNAP